MRVYCSYSKLEPSLIIRFILSLFFVVAIISVLFFDIIRHSEIKSYLTGNKELISSIYDFNGKINWAERGLSFIMFLFAGVIGVVSGFDGEINFTEIGAVMTFIIFWRFGVTVLKFFMIEIFAKPAWFWIIPRLELTLIFIVSVFFIATKAGDLVEKFKNIKDGNKSCYEKIQSIKKMYERTVNGK